MNDAECRGTDSTFFFGPAPGSLDVAPSSWEAHDISHHYEKLALHICSLCNVRLECLSFAVENPSLTYYGIWGGLTHRELKRVRRQRRNVAP
jgi:hypothetical protein